MEYAYIVVFYKYSMYIVTKLYAVQYNFYKYKQVTFLTHTCVTFLQHKCVTLHPHKCQPYFHINA